MSNKLNKNTFILAIWLLLLLFPLNWLMSVSDPADVVLAPIVDKEWVHVIMHIFIYFGLTVLLTNQFGMPKTFIAIAGYFTVFLLIALLQEYLQLQSKGRAFGGPELFDLGVDCIGILLGFYAAKKLRLRRSLEKI